MKSPGDWALLWANRERNGMTWADIVNGIREDILKDCAPECWHPWSHEVNNED